MKVKELMRLLVDFNGDMDVTIEIERRNQETECSSIESIEERLYPPYPRNHRGRGVYIKTTLEESS